MNDGLASEAMQFEENVNTTVESAEEETVRLHAQCIDLKARESH